MKKYTCKKPGRFGDRQFFIGDTIPAECIEPTREQALVSYGLIEVSEDTEAPEQPKAKPEAPAKAKPVPAAKPGKRVS